MPDDDSRRPRECEAAHVKWPAAFFPAALWAEQYRSASYQMEGIWIPRCGSFARMGLPGSRPGSRDDPVVGADARDIAHGKGSTGNDAADNPGGNAAERRRDLGRGAARSAPKMPAHGIRPSCGSRSCRGSSLSETITGISAYRYVPKKSRVARKADLLDEVQWNTARGACSRRGPGPSASAT